MTNNPTSLSEMLKSIVIGYDEIKNIHNQSMLIEKNILSVQITLENELKTSASYNERTKLNLDDINEKLANARVFFDEIEQNQAEVKALFKSINNIAAKEAALIKNVDSKISNYTELNTKNTELLAEINAIKEAVILATKAYKNDCDLALKGLTQSLARANTLNESLASKQIELNNTLESIEAAKTRCLQIANEIKEMRKRSQCLMSKAEEIFNKATWFENTLNEYIAKMQTLENNYNLAFTKNEELELKIRNNIATLDKILIALNGRSIEEVLAALKTTNNTLKIAINTKAEIDTIKANLEALLTEQNAKLDNYYTKLESDELLSLANNEIEKLQTNKANKLELEPLKTDILNLANTKANNLDLEPLKTDILNLANTKANNTDLEQYYLNSKGEELNDRLIITEAYCNDLNDKKASKDDLSAYYTKKENNNLLNTKAEISQTPILANARIVKTVGVNGDFTDLNSAFKYAAKLSATCAGDWQDYYLQLNLVSDITIVRQTNYCNPNCTIIINGKKANGKHTINYDCKAWGNGTEEIIPINIIKSNVIIRDVIFKSHLATTKKINLLHSCQNSYIEITNCDFLGNQIAYRALKTYHSHIRILNSSFDGFLWEAILFNGVSSAMCWNTSYSNCTSNCIYLQEGSNCEISNISLSKNNPARFIYLNRGSYASLNGTINLNQCAVSNVIANKPSSKGLLLYGASTTTPYKKIGSKGGLGDWTLAPVEINKPIFLTHQMAGERNTYINFYVKSGSDDYRINLSRQRPDRYRLGATADAGPCAVIIPTATSVIINISRNDDMVFAYQ
ncbi:coiled-coil domain-containing protein [Campylobacter canadensis]|uniref:hypothetical protein n=1 Tax=Campylobacter canadensis TaxID=449520 RepID=UPI001CCB9AC7|nr:hypothetical protein [Campylobacter canadensis]MBZ7995165.1 hypothetical protein [Campylobacter canadensis]MBZ8003840.1 hypothetical protein [Campylobacter canadensis]